MSRRYRVLVRKNGRECGSMSYASKAEAENAAAQMRASGTAGIEALILAPVRTENRRRNPAKRFPRSTEVQTLLFDKSAFNVTQAKTWAKAHGYRVSGTDIGGDRATKIRLRQHDPEKFTAGTFRTIEFEPGIEAVIGMPKKGAATTRGYGTRGPQRRNPSEHPWHALSRWQSSGYTDKAAARVLSEIMGWDVAAHYADPDVDPDFWDGEIEEKILRKYGYPLQENPSARRRKAAGPLRRNPMTADLASMDFDEFAKHVVIGKGYNTLSGRRFVRVHSRDNAVVTDVPVSDGGKSPAMKRAIDIKHRAYEQLRMHLAPGETLADRTNRRRRRR